jgi:formate hydrogenlyase subunit 3/multisubunit Na+/H+ antiporter MnhD subunit
MSRALIIIGLCLVILGVLWPWLQKAGLGRLPGDIVIEHDGFRLYFPITTSIIVSIVISLIFWLMRR